MSEVKAVRRALARLRHADEGASIPRIGNRPLHHFWPLLAENFRAVLMAPHHRTDEESVSWTWRETEEPTPPTPAELAELRRELHQAQERLARDVAEGRVGRGGGAASQRLAGSAEQLEAVMAAVVRDLAGQNDLGLAAYVGRTETGLRLHSWGAATPARPTYPDPHGLEISGRVLVAGKPARHDVVLESSDGETIAEVPSDEAGEFFFSKLSPGDYVLRARSMRGTFPPRGLPVELQQRSVKGLVLADGRAESVSPLVSARRASGRRSRRTAPLLVTGVLAVAGAGWAWFGLGSPAEPTVARAPAGAGQERESAPSTAARPEPSLAVLPDVAPGASTARPGLPARVDASASSTVLERPELRVEGSERDPAVVLTGSGPGSAAGGGSPAGPNGGPRGTSHLASAPAVSPDVAGSAAASPVAPAGNGGGTPAGRPEIPGSVPAPAVADSAALPAPAASGPESGPAAPGASGAGPVAAPPVVAVGHDSPPVTQVNPVPATVPAVSAAASSVPATAVADEAAVADARANAARDARPGETPTNAAESREAGPVTDTPVPSAESDLPVDARPPAREPRPNVSVQRVVRPAPVPLTRTMRVRVSPWLPRLIVDTILPTEPLPLARAESVDALRARLLAEQEARFPRALRDPSARWGVALELPPAWETGAPAWLDATGAVVAGGVVAGNRAAVRWPVETGGAERSYRLVHRDGSVLAEVQVADSGRDFTVRTSEETRAWLQLSIRTNHPDTPEAGLSAPAGGFAWRSISTVDLPPGWREVDGADPGEQVAEVPLGALPGAVALQTAALLHLESGWAIVADVRQAADRPLGR